MEQGLLPVNPAAYRRQEMVQREKAVLKQRKKLVNAKCLTLSDLVTDLGIICFPATPCVAAGLKSEAFMRLF